MKTKEMTKEVTIEIGAYTGDYSFYGSLAGWKQDAIKELNRKLKNFIDRFKCDAWYQHIDGGYRVVVEEEFKAARMARIVERWGRQYGFKVGVTA